MSTKTLRSTAYKVIWIYTKEFPGKEVPIVYLSNGRPSYVFNQWIFSLLEEEITPSKLEAYIRSVGHLYELTMALYGENTLTDKESKSLVAIFIDAKRFGTDDYCVKKSNDIRFKHLIQLGLNWKPTSTENIKNYLTGINNFDRWQSVYHSADRLNPNEVAFQNSFQIYQDFKNREKWDPFIHLHKTRRHESHTNLHIAEPEHEHSRKKNKQNKNTMPKAFPI